MFLFNIYFLQVTEFKKLYGPGFLNLLFGIVIALDTGQLSGRSDVKLGL